jgi:hypothetical protein
MSVIPTQTYNDSPDEWGIDVGRSSGVTGGTKLSTPFDAIVVAYLPSSSAWPPGRLILQSRQTGELLAFGHVFPLVKPGDVISAGTPVATVPDDVVENGVHEGPFFELMAAPPGSNPSNRNDFLRTPIPFLTMLAENALKGGAISSPLEGYLSGYSGPTSAPPERCRPIFSVGPFSGGPTTCDLWKVSLSLAALVGVVVGLWLLRVPAVERALQRIPVRV